MQKYLYAFDAVYRLWPDDGFRDLGDEVIRQPLLRTLREVAEGVYVADAKTAELLDKVVDLVDDVPCLREPQLEQLRALANEVDTYRTLDDWDFARYSYQIRMHYDDTPKESLQWLQTDI